MSHISFSLLLLLLLLLHSRRFVPPAAAAAPQALKCSTRCTSTVPAFLKMAGVTVGGKFFAFDCEEIDLGAYNLGEAALLPLLESFSQGEFTRVTQLLLVIAALVKLWLIYLTRGI